MLKLTKVSLKIISAVLFIFALFYGYTLYQIVGIEGIIAKWAPFALAILIMIMTASCTFIQQEKPNFVNNCCSVILSLLTMGIVFAIWSLALVYLTEKNDCLDIQKKQPLLAAFLDRNMEEVYFKGLQTLCSPDCPCKVENTTQQTILLDNSQKMNKSLTFSDEGAINVAECPQEVFQKYNYTDTQFQAMIMASQYEMMFNTSGYCYLFDRYLFSDINKGTPQYNLFFVQRALLRHESHFYLLSFMILFGVLVFNNFCLCCFNLSQVQEEKRKLGDLQGKLKKGDDIDIKAAKEFLEKQKQIKDKKQDKKESDNKDKEKKETNTDSKEKKE